MLLSRRSVLPLLGLPPACAWAQGIASRKLKPVARGKPSGHPFHAHFTDIAAQAGLTSPTVYGSADKRQYILESVGCGAAFFDYDNDGWLDIFVLCGQSLDTQGEPATNRLYKNNRDGTFRDVTKEAGLARSGWASGVCVGDYNNDGHEDLFITYWGQNVLYRNNGDGTFSDVTKEAGLLHRDTRWGAGCTFLDYDRDGHLDLFVSNYLEFDFASVPKPGEASTCVWKGIDVFCGPRGLPKSQQFLYRNNGDGTFTDVSERSGIAAAKESYGMTAVAADLDNDGWADIYVACDSTFSLLFRNNHDGTFTEEGLERGVALSEDGKEQAGMGIGVGDYDLDGNLDIFKTHFVDDTSGLYQNDGKGLFQDATVSSGLAVETRFIGWGAGIVDLDNDGFPDIFLVTGGVFPEVASKLKAYPYNSPRVIFRNLGNGNFEELLDQAGPGVSAVHCSRGCAFGDFDNDGDIDILIINLHEPPSLLRNDLKVQSNWLKVKLVGVTSNRSAIGATVIATYGGKRQAQAVLSQSSFYSVSDNRLHFGLGGEKSAELEIRWPNGANEKVAGVVANRLVTVREGSGIVDAKAFG
jgi:hypothetical protein